jgi:hypothetical protein
MEDKDRARAKDGGRDEDGLWPFLPLPRPGRNAKVSGDIWWVFKESALGKREKLVFVRYAVFIYVYIHAFKLILQ